MLIQYLNWRIKKIYYLKDNSKKFRDERYYQIPLCQNDCDDWFDACKDDFTCRDNWNKGFEWRNNTNFCPNHEKCETFSKKFKTAENFCNKIWDDAFKVTASENNEQCFTFNLKSGQINPNKNAAKLFYTKAFPHAATLSSSDSLANKSFFLKGLLVIVTSLLINYYF